MESFFAELLEAFTTEPFLKRVCKKYHYQDEDYESLFETAEQMLPLMREQACWNHRLFVLPESGKGAVRCAEAAMTLGKGLDELQEEYTRKGLLSACYMVEALSSELLLQAYSAYNKHVAGQYPFHVARFHFLGSEEDYPITMLPALLEGLEMPVACNGAFCMTPKKSVAFVAELTEDVAVRCPGICVGCKGGAGRGCPNRVEDGFHMLRLLADMTDVPLSYGYSRIFGKR